MEDRTGDIHRKIRLASSSEVESKLALLPHASTPSLTQEVIVGQPTRQAPHTPRSLAPEFDLRKLAELFAHFPHLRAFKVVSDADLKAVFPLSAETPTTSPSFLAWLHNAVFPSDVGRPELFVEKDVRIAIPQRSSWQSAALSAAPALVLLASVMRLEMSEVSTNVDVALAHSGRVMGFFGGSLHAFREFGIVLFSRHASIDIRVLTIAWTSASVRASEMALALYAGLSVCTTLQHLTLAVFLGPNAAADLEEQWQANIDLLAAATRRSALQSFTLVVHVDGATPKYLDHFKVLPWGEVTNLLIHGGKGKTPLFFFKVVGAPPDVSEEIEASIELGLGHGPYVVGRSRELSFATSMSRYAIDRISYGLAT